MRGVGGERMFLGEALLPCGNGVQQHRGDPILVPHGSHNTRRSEVWYGVREGESE